MRRRRRRRALKYVYDLKALIGVPSADGIDR
jgi:hypothetical protein